MHLKSRCRQGALGAAAAPAPGGRRGSPTGSDAVRAFDEDVLSRRLECRAGPAGVEGLRQDEKAGVDRLPVDQSGKEVSHLARLNKSAPAGTRLDLHRSPRAGSSAGRQGQGVVHPLSMFDDLDTLSARRPPAPLQRHEEKLLRSPALLSRLLLHDRADKALPTLPTPALAGRGWRVAPGEQAAATLTSSRDQFRETSGNLGFSPSGAVKSVCLKVLSRGYRTRWP